MPAPTAALARWRPHAGLVLRSGGLVMATVLLLVLVWLLYDNAMAPTRYRIELPVTVMALAEQPLGPQREADRGAGHAAATPPPAASMAMAAPAPLSALKPAATAASPAAPPRRPPKPAAGMAQASVPGAAQRARATRVPWRAPAAVAPAAARATPAHARLASARPRPAPAAPRRAGAAALSAPDSDVALLAAVLAHARNLAPPALRSAPVDGGGASLDATQRLDGVPTAALLQRCRQLDGADGLLCRSRLCAGSHARHAACQ